ncbi:DEKNAAC105070 [Brettanomyces naardenensis]|uniref:DEKNAAC105070 n=1 Tax=Brettanomyces naardenensis TaxID=13370 RepID=A0A448YS25_BRENA|nr:DEKNAAC105070 [Brettanomyces naardenensis]
MFLVKPSLWSLLLFPCLLTIGLTIRLFIWIVNINIDPLKTPLVSRAGVLNVYFAGYSFEIFLVIFLLITGYIYLYKSQLVHYVGKHIGTLLPVTTDDLTPTQPKARMLARQVLKLVIIYTWLSSLIVWFFGDSIFGRILKFTGGKCSNGDPKLGYHHCLAQDGNQWVGGVKLSGHSLILTCFTVSILFEQLTLFKLYRINDSNDLHLRRCGKELHAGIQALAFILVIVWAFMFLITAIFYHTTLEKVVGVACGLFIPYLLNIRYGFYFNPLL